MLYDVKRYNKFNTKTINLTLAPIFSDPLWPDLDLDFLKQDLRTHAVHSLDI